MMFDWIKYLGILDELDVFRTASMSFKKKIPEFVIYSLPNALWLFGGILLFRGIWQEQIKWERIYIFSFVMICLFAEILQIFNFFPGTFDFMDLLLIFIVLGMDFFINTCIRKRRKLSVKKND